MTETNERKSSVFIKIEKECYLLGYNPIFEKEKWSIPEGWKSRGEFESFQVVKKARPTKVLTTRNHKLVYVDLFGNEIFEKEKKVVKQEVKVVEVKKIEEKVEKIIRSWKDENFMPDEETPF